MLDSLIEQILNSDVLEESLEISSDHYDEAIAHLSDIEQPVKGYLLEIAEKLKKRLI